MLGGPTFRSRFRNYRSRIGVDSGFLPTLSITSLHLLQKFLRVLIVQIVQLAIGLFPCADIVLLWHRRFAGNRGRHTTAGRCGCRTALRQLILRSLGQRAVLVLILWIAVPPERVPNPLAPSGDAGGSSFFSRQPANTVRTHSNNSSRRRRSRGNHRLNPAGLFLLLSLRPRSGLPARPLVHRRLRQAFSSRWLITSFFSFRRLMHSLSVRSRTAGCPLPAGAAARPAPRAPPSARAVPCSSAAHRCANGSGWRLSWTAHPTAGTGSAAV
uniref:Uncharacterized protein n=1 Tax=Anopheles coluzzii TaxID=1518534 RepID=A0A8W7PK68_ANOCL